MSVFAEAGLEQKIRDLVKGAVKVGEPLSRHTSLHIGGPAKFFVEPVDRADLSAVVQFFNRRSTAVYVMGEGSNLLVSDDGLDAAVVRLRSAFFRRIAVQNNLVFAAAGVPLAALCIYAEKNGLSGCEFLSGIPGTVGGALVMNAGSREVDADQGAGRVCSMSQIVSQLEVMNRHGEVSLYAKEDVEFGYRSSNLKGMIVLGAWFRLAPADRDAIKQRGERFIGRKRTTQDLTLPSAGCVFKNPAESRHGAGALIDQCRLKGTVVGDAQVSTIHANFIVNKGNARFAEVKALMELVQTKVWEHCSVRLEPEVEIWGQGGLR